MKVETYKGELWRLYKSNYYVSNRGRVKRIYATYERLLNPYKVTTKRGHNRLIFRIDGKEQMLARAVYACFCGELKPGYRIHHKDNHYRNNDFLNLEQLSMSEMGRKTGGRTRLRKLVYCSDNERIYKGTREAGKALHISRQTVSDYCNGKVKKPRYNLRWLRR